MVNRTAAGCRYLLLRAYDYWDFPKGLVEGGEDPAAAAVRECAEEAGLVDVELPTDDFYETAPYGRGKVARYYVGLVPPETSQDPIRLPVSPELGRPEHHEGRWCTLVEARELLNERVRGALDWAVERRGY